MTKIGMDAYLGHEPQCAIKSNMGYCTTIDIKYSTHAIEQDNEPSKHTYARHSNSFLFRRKFI